MARKTHDEPADETATSAPEVPSDYHDDAWVEILPAAHLVGETARALLDAAEHLGYDVQLAVRTIGGGFRVPKDVADAVELPTEPDGQRRTVATPLAALEQGATPDGPDPVTDAPA